MILTDITVIHSFKDWEEAFGNTERSTYWLVQDNKCWLLHLGSDGEWRAFSLEQSPNPSFGFSGNIEIEKLDDLYFPWFVIDPESALDFAKTYTRSRDIMLGKLQAEEAERNR